MRLAALTLATLLAGCASQPLFWHKDGGTENDFLSDLGVCRAQAFGITGVSMMQAAIVQQSCLQGKGWRQAPGQAANAAPAQPMAGFNSSIGCTQGANPTCK